jgi:hypothetical protein
MLRVKVISAAALALPSLAAPNTLTVNLWPDSNPETSVFCTISLADGQLSAVEAKGLGLQNPRPLHWWASVADQSAFLTGIEALIAGEIPSVNPLDAPLLAPPFLTVTWISNLDGQISSGRYTTRDLSLPKKLATLLDTVIPGSYCRSIASP